MQHLVANTDWNKCTVSSTSAGDRDHRNGHLLLQVCVLLMYVIPMTSLPPHCVKDIMWAPLPIISVMAAILGPGI